MAEFISKKFLIGPELRYKRTINFMKESLPPPAHLLDLGEENRLSTLLSDMGYIVQNTQGDLDLHPEIVKNNNVDAVTAFEILEHLIAPFNVIRSINAPRLFATVPLNLWFSKAHYNKDDPWDRHFHEFEEWQFDALLEKAGWIIIRRDKWNNPVIKPGFRPILRLFTPHYYAVEAVREEA